MGGVDWFQVLCFLIVVGIVLGVIGSFIFGISEAIDSAGRNAAERRAAEAAWKAAEPARKAAEAEAAERQRIEETWGRVLAGEPAPYRPRPPRRPPRWTWRTLIDGKLH